MRIISNGEDYYLDSRGRKLKPAGYVADMVVATGNISSKFAQQHLVAMGRFLRDDAFWNNQIEQINVAAKRAPAIGAESGKPHHRLWQCQ